ncbi:MAG: ATP-binding protein [Spirochaetales bacterium]|nr:ATP-binding protein [Spirochaetales bacterium]
MGSLILIILFFFLAGRIITGIIEFGPTYIDGRIIIILCLIITLLLIMVGTHLYHFFIREKDGLRLQYQLVLLFFILILFASIPQTLLAMEILESILGSWSGSSLEETLDDSSDFLTSYYEGVEREILSMGESAALGTMMDEYGETGSFPWEELSQLNPSIESLQLFRSGEEDFYGVPEYRVDGALIEPYGNSLLPARAVLGRVLITYVRQEGDLKLVFTASLLPGTADLGGRLIDNRERLLAYNHYRQDSLRWKLYILVFFTLPLILISINLGLLFARNMIHPIRELGKALRRVTEGDYSYRISSKEFGMYDFYVDIFNEMIDELNNSRSELVQTEKIGVWRDIAQRLAHEIRNPLTPIKLNAQRILLKTAEMDEDTQKYLMTPMNRILKEVDELDLLLREFREFAGQRAPVLRSIPLSLLVDEVWDSYGKETEDVIFSHHDEQKERVIQGDPSQLKQVFRNIFSNALEAMEFKGRLSVRISSVRKGVVSFCRVAIRDWGRGIDQETLSRIFEPYYTTRKNGTGLGLPIVERIVTDHKGRIWVKSSPGEGTVFYIDLPAGRSL